MANILSKVELLIVMCKVFIDTNVFLRLYQTKEGNITRIFEDISKLKSSIVFVDQVFDEFLRNRDKILMKQIENVSNQKIKNLHVTPLIKSLDEFSDLVEARKLFDINHKKLLSKIEKIKDDIKEDVVYKNFCDLYSDSALTKYVRTDEIIDKAHTRMLIGNPPIDDEKNTIGDQIIWETLISNLNDDLIFITYDSTYEDHISFLKAEYRSKVNKDLHITEKVSFALSKIKEKPSTELREFEKFDRHTIKPKVTFYTESPLVSAFVNLRNYKLWYLDILDIDLYYEDSTEIRIEPSDNPNFSTALEDLESTQKESEMYPSLKKIEDDFKEYISLLLEKEGYGKIEASNIEYEIVEFIEPND